ncbi:fluoride efflux transporter FluC [Neobacillus thermocopriae]|uniref:Fluoride-specific ion channel FluC n=1 Tax=Neobacillus thermocopriae TaxID=1215031 RepID=A0A6B3TRU5_9BACI|nr:CrcB family protein [Neobacillus thermocopriae]MED3623805.1 CrcB family protein [Neobacillus thermocopriae]MED3712986.1 CrcB family protein [Neobacillus thermocopriae]NEX79079.1 CrcB family protein [Neobacillus thermocopriae]
MIYFWVGLAGMLGAILRYLVGMMIFTNSPFPFSTFIINIIGSFLLAWLTTNIFKRLSISPDTATIVGTGLVGSFTTFSTLSVETVELFQNGHTLLGIVYVTISIFGGLGMGRLGFYMNREEQES